MTEKLTPAGVRAYIKAAVDIAVEKGDVLGPEKAIEASVLKEVVANHDKVPESTKLLLLALLFRFELLRAQALARGATHH